jgi:mannose-6-phosphate isomerase-like protein (cupin superfamily)
MVRYAYVLFSMLTLLMTVPLISIAQEASPIPTGPARATPIWSGTDIATETLAEIRLPAASIPPSPAIVDVWLATLAPGQEIGFETGASPPSIVADVVLSGEFTVLSEGRLQVQQAAGREDVPANTVVTIHPGEAVIYVDNQAEQTFRNTGRGTLTAVSFGIFSAAPPSTFTAGSVSQEDWKRSGLAGQDLTFRVERQTVPPRGSLPAFVPDLQTPRIFVVAEGVAQWVIIPPGGATPTAAVPFGRGETIRFRTLENGEQLQLRNEETQPLVLLQVTLTADHTATPAAGPEPLRKWPVSPSGTVTGD